MAIEFEALGWQDKQGNPPALALSLKGGLEPGAAIHLDGPDSKGHALLEGVQRRLCSRVRRGCMEKTGVTPKGSFGYEEASGRPSVPV